MRLTKYFQKKNKNYFGTNFGLTSNQLQELVKKNLGIGYNSNGYLYNNQDSCLCGGKDPAYCCDPDSDTSNCKCPDGSLKNLCNNECFLPTKPYKVEILGFENYTFINTFLCDNLGIIFNTEDLSTFEEFACTITYRIYDNPNRTGNYWTKSIDSKIKQQPKFKPNYIVLDIPDNIQSGYLVIDIYGRCGCCIDNKTKQHGFIKFSDGKNTNYDYLFFDKKNVNPLTQIINYNLSAIFSFLGCQSC